MYCLSKGLNGTHISLRGAFCRFTEESGNGSKNEESRGYGNSLQVILDEHTDACDGKADLGGGKANFSLVHMHPRVGCLSSNEERSRPSDGVRQGSTGKRGGVHRVNLYYGRDRSTTVPNDLLSHLRLFA